MGCPRRRAARRLLPCPPERRSCRRRPSPAGRSAAGMRQCRIARVPPRSGSGRRTRVRGRASARCASPSRAAHRRSGSRSRRNGRHRLPSSSDSACNVPRTPLPWTEHTAGAVRSIPGSTRLSRVDPGIDPACPRVGRAVRIGAMNDADVRSVAGPERDFVGYGPEPPAVRWPGGALVAINLVINYEEGGEYSLGDDGCNDTWGEYSFQYGPEIRDLGTETHMEYGSRVGIWRVCRLIDRYRIPATFNAV